MSDPVTSNFAKAATYMVARFMADLATKDPQLTAAVYEAHRQGARMHVGMTTGGGKVEIELEMINDYGTRRLVASIEHHVPEAETAPGHSNH
jgi:hypothetical protein